MSIPRRCQELGLSYCTLWYILYLDVHLRPYKAQPVKQLKPADHSQCRRYVEYALKQQAVDGKFSNKIFFNHEAHFTLGGYANKQNCRIWASEALQVIKERS